MARRGCLFRGQQKVGLYGSLRAEEVVEAAEKERDWKQESTSWAEGIWHSLL
jgi:hypothetical protein